jgi:hypothetical protein
MRYGDFVGQSVGQILRNWSFPIGWLMGSVTRTKNGREVIRCVGQSRCLRDGVGLRPPLETLDDALRQKLTDTKQYDNQSYITIRYN